MKMKVPGLGSKSGNLSESKKYEDGTYELRLIKSEFVDNSENAEKPGTMYKFQFEFINEPDVEKSVIGEKFTKVVFFMDENHPKYNQEIIERALNELANVYAGFKMKIVNDEIIIGNDLDKKDLSVKATFKTWVSKDKSKTGQNVEFSPVD